VGTKQVINNSLLAKDFKAGQLPRGPQGPQGEAGEQGPEALRRRSQETSR
jgi:hypothetical protein